MLHVPPERDEFDLLHLMLLAHDELERLFRAAAGTPARGVDLVVLRRASGGGVTVSWLYEELRVSRQAAHAHVRRLLAQGHLADLPHPRDARAMLLTLTADGRAHLDALQEALGECLAELDDVLPAAHVPRLVRDLEALADVHVAFERMIRKPDQTKGLPRARLLASRPLLP
ncbi:MAG TPA: MarR family transcriptional regulator [Dermatophilaceae bacterium]|nr:MarR family transcriptional regulator [Dermatophilaceae bacterium]